MPTATTASTTSSSAPKNCKKSLSDEFHGECGVLLLEGYGLTETAPVCGTNVCRTEGSAEQPYYVPGYKFGSIGHVLPGSPCASPTRMTTTSASPSRSRA